MNTPCLFCARDDQRANTVLMESDAFYVRLDNYPAAAGHVQIVPKRHVVSWFEISPHEVAEAHGLLLAARNLLDRLHQPDGYTIGVNEGRAAGRTIDHAHLHLIPRHTGDVADPRGGVRRIFADCDPDSWR